MTARRANKVDANHADVVAALRAAGCSVQSLAPIGGGVPDLVVGLRNEAGEPVNLLMEVKDEKATPHKRRWALNVDQALWHAYWTGQVCVVCSVSEALAVVETARRGG